MSANAIAVDPDGRFAGYASVFGEVDQGGDIVMPGAFKASLKRKGAGKVRMLFQHDPKEPIGLWHQVVEDGFGLWVEGQLLPQVPRADALRHLLASRAVDGLSIGFRTKRASKDASNGHRHLWQIDLWEISIVTFPMMDGARIKSCANVSRQEPRRMRSPGETISAAISLLRNQ